MCVIAVARSGQGHAILMIVVALVCLLVLLLPLEGESPGWLSYLHATVNQKLIAAFALGTQHFCICPTTVLSLNITTCTEYTHTHKEYPFLLCVQTIDFTPNFWGLDPNINTCECVPVDKQFTCQRLHRYQSRAHDNIIECLYT